MNFLAINVAAGANRTHARSALPDAPVVEDKPRRRPVRTAFRTLRAAFTGARAAADGTRTAPDQNRPATRHTTHKPAESC